MPNSGFQINFVDLIASSSLVTKLVMVLLLVLSVVSGRSFCTKPDIFEE